MRRRLVVIAIATALGVGVWVWGTTARNRALLSNPTVVAVQEAPPLLLSKVEPYPWEPCDESRYPSIRGNSWQGEFRLCAGNLRIGILVDSVRHGGPIIYGPTATTAACGTQKAGGKSQGVPESFVLMNEAAQLAEIRRLVEEAVTNVSPECGGPFEANHVLNGHFDQRFIEFADRYWRNLTREELEQSVQAQRRDRP